MIVNFKKKILMNFQKGLNIHQIKKNLKQGTKSLTLN